MNSLRVGFHLPLTAQAREEVLDLQSITAEFQINTSDNDAWSYDWGYKFTSAKYYQFYFRDIEVHEAFKWIWKSKCTMKLKVFSWLLLVDRLNTKNMLRRRHYVVGPPVNKMITASSVGIDKRKRSNTYSSGVPFRCAAGPRSTFTGARGVIGLKCFRMQKGIGPGPCSWRCL